MSHNLSFTGGGNLTITGTGFGSTGAVVMIGNAECIMISQSDTEVMCAIPSHNPGYYDVELSIGENGFADTRYLMQPNPLRTTCQLVNMSILVIIMCPNMTKESSLW